MSVRTAINKQTILLNRDFQEVPLVGVVDTIITDPPYPKKFNYLWKPLAEWAMIALKPGGSILSIVPHYYLPGVLRIFGKAGLKYRWTIAMMQSSGSHPRMAMGVEVCWKPVVWWVKGAWPQGRGFIKDAFVNDQPEKAHEWEQNISWAEAMLKFNPVGGVVADPMMGTGTVGAACVAAGVPFIGIDNDPAAYQRAAERLTYGY